MLVESSRHMVVERQSETKGLLYLKSDLANNLAKALELDYYSDYVLVLKNDAVLLQKGEETHLAVISPVPNYKQVRVLETECSRIPADLTFAFTINNKLLHIFVEFISEDEVVINNFIENIDGIPAVKGSTTAVFEASYYMCQNIANMMNVKIEFDFQTKYNQLKKWALTQGHRIFQWDSLIGKIPNGFESFADGIESSSNKGQILNLEKEIVPNL